jgi:hypothetical protein
MKKLNFTHVLKKCEIGNEDFLAFEISTITPAHRFYSCSSHTY